MMCSIFRSIRGVLVMLVPCWEHLCRGTLQPIVQHSWWPSSVSEEIRNDQKFRHLETMWFTPGRSYDYSFDTFGIAIKSLHEKIVQTCKGIEQQPFDWTLVLHWPAQIIQEFLVLLEIRSMEAWVIVAHFAMLPAKVEGIFWREGSATNIITAVAIFVGEENWNWIA
jgi:hypothetical protein